MKFAIRTLIVFLFKMCCLHTSLFAIVIDNVVVVNADCPANGTLTVLASGGIGSVKYELERPDGSKTPTQTANLFQNLAPGVYRVNVYDGVSGAAIGASSSVEVKSNYTEFSLNEPFTYKDFTVQCTYNGVIHAPSRGGKVHFVAE